ncbi:hypothetical protein OTK49_02565 [Vibrio coralliirubri]|uniref:hypothetical protein n=1 Tax=Vibrio coralliirubri TaxID=1516159 RepID=UPI002283F2BB|nr:hypothetical protein [Vibrio coralliirubri]MCY9861400.1 hypothetical protein [Vibrio coralliirubri]
MNTQKTTQAILLAFLSDGGKHEGKTISKLATSGLLVGMYLVHRQTKTKQSPKPMFYRNIAALSESITHHLTKNEDTPDAEALKSLSTSTLSEALKALHQWGVIEYETNVEARRETLRVSHGTKKGIRLKLKQTVLANVTERINNGHKASTVR